MAQNTAFSRSAFSAGGSTSWADDDDLDDAPLPLVSSLPKVEEHDAPRAESPRRTEQQHDRRDRKHSNEYRERDQGHRERGAYEDRGGRGGDRGGYQNERREERAPRYENDRPKNPVPDQGPYRVYVGNLSFRATEADLVDFFGSPESVTDVRVQRDRDTDRPKGFAYVEFRDREALVEALKLDGQNVDGRAIRIDVATDNRKPRQSGGNSFFEKRGGDRPQYERRGQDAPRSEAPRERPRLTLAPRSAATENNENSAAKKQNIFGDAKPRDESAVWERKKAMDAEGERKPKPDHAKNRGPREHREPREHRGEPREHREPRERKASHDGAAEGHAGGRGGRGRGERTERTGGRGRGPAAHPERAAPAKKEPKAVESKSKTVEPKAPKTTKMPAAPATKVKNVFALLNDDSDSD